MESKMIRIPRWILSLLGVLFASYHAVLGIWSLPEYINLEPAVFAIVFYLATVLPTVLLYRGLELPIAQGILNVAAACIVPLIIDANLDPKDMTAYSTWYVIGIATLMSATAVRQQRLLAWLGTLVLALQVVLWAGLDSGFQTGLTGALLLVFAGHTISVGLAKAFKDTMAYNQQTLEIQTQQATNSAASEIRRNRLGSALIGALPLLTLIKSQQGKLTPEQKNEARLLEASLRDDIRGRELISDSVRAAALDARRRGIEVTILDEGGLDSLPADKKFEILEKVAEGISTVREGRITLRAPANESWSVTLLVTRAGIAKPDLWLKL
jgi:hypothetical protein